MADEIYVDASNNALVTVRSFPMGGTLIRSYRGESVSAPGYANPGELFIQEGIANSFLRWVGSDGVVYSGTGRPLSLAQGGAGQAHLTSEGALRWSARRRNYADGSLIFWYDINWNEFTNNQGIPLFVFANSARTQLLFSVAPGATYLYPSSSWIYYCRVGDSGANFQVQPYAGASVAISGSPSSPTWNYI